MGALTLLLVEDNPGDARLIQEALQADPTMVFELQHVERLSEAQACLRARVYSAALVDLALPDSHGTETIRRVRQTADSVPIVVLTSTNQQSAAMEALSAGAQDYLVKGESDGPTVSRAIRYAIERHHLQRRLGDAQRLETIGRIAGGVAHHFNNLMTAILGNAQILSSHAAGRADRDALDEIVTAATKATELTAHLLSAGRQQRLAPRRINLNDALQGMRDLLAQMVGPDLGIALDLGEVPPIFFDVLQLERTVSALTLLARMEASGGSIRLSTAPAQAGSCSRLAARLSIDYDVPPGRSELSERDFEPFNDLRALVTQRRTGLELPGVRGVMEQSGGRLEWAVHPTGIVFHLDFPAPPAPALIRTLQ